MTDYEARALGAAGLRPPSEALADLRVAEARLKAAKALVGWPGFASNLDDQREYDEAYEACIPLRIEHSRASHALGLWRRHLGGERLAKPDLLFMQSVFCPGMDSY